MGLEDTDNIASRAHRSLADALALTTERIGGTVERTDTLQLTAGRHPQGIFINSALPLGGLEPDEVIARSEAFFGPRNYRYEVWADSADEALAAAAQEAGMRLCIEMAIMVATSPPPVPADVDLRCAAGALGLEDFLSVSQEVYIDDEEMPEFPEMIRATYHAPRALLHADTAVVIAYVGDQPAAAAVSITIRKNAYICWVGTRPAFRRRGLGSAVTARAIAEGFARGATLGVLEATDGGQPLYARLGFASIGAYRIYWHFHRGA